MKKVITPGTPLHRLSPLHWGVHKKALYSLFVLLLPAIGLLGCGGSTSSQSSVPAARWVSSLTAGADTGYNIFYASAVDTSGNVYGAGKIYGTGTYDFGNGVTAAGQVASGFSVLVVKYNSSGKAQWAKTLSAGSSHSTYYAVVVDSSGNVYAAGAINGNNSFGFGNGVTATGPTSGSGASGDNLVLVKYSSDGTAQWARTVSGASSSAFSPLRWTLPATYTPWGPSMVRPATTSATARRY